MATKDELKVSFGTGKIPTGADFADLIDAGGVATVSGVAPDASGNVALTKTNVGLANVTNVSQASKVEFNALNTSIGEQGVLVPAVLADTVDLDTVTTQGTYIKASSQTVTNGPVDMPLHFTLSVIGADKFCTQIMYEVNGTDKTWERSLNSQTVTWTGWTLRHQTSQAQYDDIIARLVTLETP